MSATSDDRALSSLLSSLPKPVERAREILTQLRFSTGPHSVNRIDSQCTPALLGISALLACHSLGMKDYLDQKMVQATSGVAPSHFNKALKICQFVTNISLSSSQASSPRGSPRSAPQKTVTFQSLAKELSDENVVKVVQWAGIVKQRLGEEMKEAGYTLIENGQTPSNPRKAIDLNSAEFMEDLWVWVVDAWGITPSRRVPVGMDSRMESFLPLMKDQIKDDYRRLRASASASSSSTSSAPNSPGVLSRSDRASRRVSITQSPPSNRSIPVRTPIKARPAAAPSPSDSDATPPASQRPQRTPTKAPPPRHLLKHTPSRPSPLKNAMSSRKRKSPSPTPVDLPDLYAVPEERVVVQKKVRRSFIDDVGDDEGAVEARYVKYLKWRKRELALLEAERARPPATLEI